MITGDELFNASHEAYAERYAEEDARNHTSGGGITLKQHMVIEFTKALLTGLHSNQEMYVQVRDTLRLGNMDFDDGVVKMAIEYSTAVIKQLNEEQNG